MANLSLASFSLQHNRGNAPKAFRYSFPDLMLGLHTSLQLGIVAGKSGSWVLLHLEDIED